ncbi:hypothetical protein MWU60_17775 [Yoonia sp. F2084L]|uniref:hypothetical protein n=1 Tax=Yoonia sp. F2084L TaxID=2926419 RepID=UPI001FF2058F|nr:hypothetical protein [Yoonia sp. F2084L]MCK0097430.1 hypothetical protein [Yoonia sp. F2084L]
MDASQILKQIGSKLWSIFREDADLSHFNFKGFPDSRGGDMSIVFFKNKELLIESLNSDNPWPVWEEMRTLAYELQKMPEFKIEPFTNMKFALRENGKMDVQFAYIPEWDSWPGLYMKGVSQIPEAEIGKHNIPHDIWLERVKMAKERPYA